jgi:hypothetical protein
MDDGTLGGDVTNLLYYLDIIKSVGSKLGLIPNELKCELVTADADVLAVARQKMPDVIHVAPEDATLLGAPVGGQRVITSTLIAKPSEMQQLSDGPKYLNIQYAFFLLKNCFSLPKLLYILRCAPCVECPVIKQYDTAEGHITIDFKRGARRRVMGAGNAACQVRRAWYANGITNGATGVLGVSCRFSASIYYRHAS